MILRRVADGHLFVVEKDSPKLRIFAPAVVSTEKKIPPRDKYLPTLLQKFLHFLNELVSVLHQRLVSSLTGLEHQDASEEDHHRKWHRYVGEHGDVADRDTEPMEEDGDDDDD